MEMNVLLSDMIEFVPPTMGVIVAALIAAFLLFVSGFASGSEIAFFSLSPSDINELEEEKSEEDKQIRMLREDSERTLATILITNNFVNVTIIMLCNYVFGSVVKFKVAWLEFLCITVLLTFLLLLFGEIMPKVYSRQNPLKFCRRVVGPLLMMRKLFWPLENVLLRSGNFAEKVVQKESRQLSVDDLEQALELTDKEELKDEQSMLKRIIRFGDETAKEIMTSRQDIVDLDINSSAAGYCRPRHQQQLCRCAQVRGGEQLFAHPSISGQRRQHTRCAVYQGPAALSLQAFHLPLAEFDTTALLCS